jgi:pyridoxamine 5'-phosphate oxidase-like protein
MYGFEGIKRMDQQDLGTIARTIIDSVVYMVLGTADETGRPWVSPVYFASGQYREFYWMSSPEATHSRNILVRPQVSVVVFDSRVAVGMGQAVYMAAVAEELTGASFDRGIQIYNGRFENPTEYGVQAIKSEDVQAPALYRLYRAIVQEHWVLDPDGHPDHRIQIIL